MRWITREHPKIDRVACPWLITRFIDPKAEFIFVPPARVDQDAASMNAIPFDVEGVELSHDGPLCSFDAFLKKYEIDDDALSTIATIVRGADTARPDLAPEAPGLRRCLSDCRRSSRTTMRCFVMDSSCTMLFTRGASMLRTRLTPGTRSAQPNKQTLRRSRKPRAWPRALIWRYRNRGTSLHRRCHRD